MYWDVAVEETVLGNNTIKRVCRIFGRWLYGVLVSCHLSYIG